MKTGIGPASPDSVIHPSAARPGPSRGVRFIRLIKEPLEYALFLSLHAVARVVPFRAATAIGRCLGGAIFRFTGIRKRVTMENLRRAFPGRAEAELREIALGAFRNYGISITQMLWAGGAGEEELRSKVRVIDRSPFDRALAQGKGVLLLSAHFGTWEFLVNAVRLQLGQPLLCIVQNQRNRRINAFVSRLRTRFGNETVEMGHSIRTTLQALSRGRVVLLLGDQSGSKESLFIDFFGRPAATHRGAAAFSLKSGAPIVMAFLLRRPDGGADLICEEVDRSGLTGTTDDEVTELTRRHAAVLERMIRRHPDHWLWMHKRWKHSPDPLPSRAVIVQTAFPGDVVLALPLAQLLKELNPPGWVGFVATPESSALLAGHPAIDEVISFDKRGKERGIGGLRRIARHLRERRPDVAFIPHQSIRSALLVRMAGIPRRIGFDRSAGRLLWTDTVSYDPTKHEIERVLSLASPLAQVTLPMEPKLFPSADDVAEIHRRIREWDRNGGIPPRMVAIAPGSVWATKRWPPERFAVVISGLIVRGWNCVLIGGGADRDLCLSIERRVGNPGCLNVAGSLTFLQSAELVRRCELLISNDSAPVHIASAMQTPVLAIFGPTIPAFGFGPRGPHDITLGVENLSCRPCGIHGGNRCPTGTFECMLSITPDQVIRQAEALLHVTRASG